MFPVTDQEFRMKILYKNDQGMDLRVDTVNQRLVGAHGEHQALAYCLLLHFALN